MKRHLLLFLALSCTGCFSGGLLQAKPARNPIIWADVPDVAVIRVGDTYYMSSTTMHMSPGLPIMKSKDLVNWELIGYAYDTLTDNEALRLENGRNAYGAGSWASSLRYHDGTYYVSTFSRTSGRTHVYTTKDIEKGPWKETTFAPSLHDHSLFFDDDGRVYMLYGGGNLRLVELESDLSGIKEGGFNEVVIRNASAVAGGRIGLQAEGSQLRKINGKYYVMNITWPRGGMRTQIIHRADKITGPYEGKVILQDKGVAQGCLIDTPDGKWYAVLFQDNGSVGRSPWLVPVKWEDGWPVLGVDGKAPMTLDIDDNEEGLGNIAASDEFNRKPGEPLPLAWQWNHNPDNRYWSIGERSGFLRLTTGRVDSEVLQARNTLTQRTFGPVSSATTKIDTGNMKDGDCMGLIALQKKYGFVGVKMEGSSKSIVMVSAQSNKPEEIESIPLKQQTVYLKIECDFRNRTDKAHFYYSLNGKTWTKIRSVLQMSYTLPHFMGYRFGLFNFATKMPGGFVDFDFFRVSNEMLPPLVDLGPGQTYKGKEGGLYPGGSNVRPAAHDAAGRKIARDIVPLDANGNPDPVNGKIVFTLVSVSNAYGAWHLGDEGETSTTFMTRAKANPAKNPKLCIAYGFEYQLPGGNRGTGDPGPNSIFYRILDHALHQQGLTPKQVQIVWLFMPVSGKSWGINLPPEDRTFPADAQESKNAWKEIVHAIHIRYPNVKIIYSSTKGAMYMSAHGNDEWIGGPIEPWNHDAAWGVKWVIEDQINGAPDLNYDPTRGPVKAPWLSWGPYFWSYPDGTPRHYDGFVWTRADVAADGLHPSLSGLTKYATMLLHQMTTDPTATPWFVKPGAATNQPPAIAKAASVAANPVSGMTTVLSVLGADDGGESNLTYTWSCSGPADVTFSINGPNKAKNTTVTFQSAGRYTFRVMIADAGGLTATSSIAVTVLRP